MLIAVLEDDPVLSRSVVTWLEEAGHEVLVARTLKEFYSKCMSQPLDIVVIDWELPDGTGMDVLLRIKSELGQSVAALFVTQRDTENDTVMALNAGADDYLVKPARKNELIARVNAIGRRTGLDTQSQIITLGPISVDMASRQVSINGEPIKLTNKDYHLACCILSNPGKLLSRDFLLRTVWGVSGEINTRTVDVHISRVRRALSIGPEIGYVLVNVYQHGYRLEKLPTSKMEVSHSN